MLFGLLALLALPVRNLKKTWWVGGTLLLALLSKETGILFALPLIGESFWDKKNNRKLTAAAVGGAVFVYALLRFGVAGMGMPNKTALGPMMAPLSQRWMSIPKIISWYGYTFIWPEKLTISQNWIVKELNWPDFYKPLIWDGLMLGAFIGGVFIARKRNKLMEYLFFSGWLAVGMAGHAQIIPLDLTVSDRWFYWSEIGLLGMGLTLFGGWSGWKKKAGITIIIIWVAALATRSWFRTGDWKNSMTLYKHDSQISTDSFDLENNFGVELTNAGKYEEARFHFTKSIQLFPYRPFVWANIGETYYRQKNLVEAEKYYELATTQKLPGPYVAYEKLSNMTLFANNNPDKALDLANQGIQIYPEQGGIWLLRALSLNQLGRNVEAAEAAKKAILLNPTDINRQVLEAITAGQKIKLNPN